jgi:hypothetical protein
VVSAFYLVLTWKVDEEVQDNGEYFVIFLDELQLQWATFLPIQQIIAGSRRITHQ